jgi:predicted O-methyltransferase YrrM
MSHQIHKIKKRIQHRFKAGHNRGFGIHSPYLYRLITSVLEEKCPYYHYARVESLRKELKTDLCLFDKRTKNRFSFRYNKTEAHCGQLLFRLIQDGHYQTLLELGTTTGLETQYMALANSEARCLSITSSAELAAIAQKGFIKQNIQNIVLQIVQNDKDIENIINSLERIDFVLFNNILSSKRISDLLESCLLKKTNGSIFAFKNIHSNPDNDKLWKKIRKRADVQVTMDLYHLGIVVFNTELEKRNYVIRIK